jgi:hypothetical protein
MAVLAGSRAPLLVVRRQEAHSAVAAPAALAVPPHPNIIQVAEAVPVAILVPVVEALATPPVRLAQQDRVEAEEGVQIPVVIIIPALLAAAVLESMV